MHALFWRFLEGFRSESIRLFLVFGFVSPRGAWDMVFKVRILLGLVRRRIHRLVGLAVPS